MAKRNSTKTATKEALQRSEPSLLASRQFGGINIANSAFDWKPDLSADSQRLRQQSDLQTNFLMVQNNVDTTSNMTMETRYADRVVATAPDGCEFTGVSYLKDDVLMMGVAMGGRHGVVYGTMDGSVIDDWQMVSFEKVASCIDGSWEYTDENTDWLPTGWTITAISCIMKSMTERLLIIANDGDEEDQSDLFLGSWSDKSVRNYAKVYPDSCGIDVSESTVDMDSDDSCAIAWEKSDGTSSWGDGTAPTDYQDRVVIWWSSVNELGATELSDNWIAVYTDTSELEMSLENLVRVTVPVATCDEDVMAINLYTTTADQTAPMWWKQVAVSADMGSIVLEWKGSMEDDVTDELDGINMNYMVDDENHTTGPRCTDVEYIDGRLYFYGDRAKPYRVSIGAGTNAETYCSSGAGGGYIDIQQDSSTTVNAVHKWKTTSGASIVTCLCGNNNTGRVKRYNIIETSTTITNEISGVSYTAEEVANVVGSNSRHASGVFENGLYVLTRYGLATDTAQMEYNGTMQMQYVSDNIKPVFSDRSGLHMDNAYVVYTDGVAYIAFAKDDEKELDHVILVYDMGIKAWWTYTVGDSDDIIKALMPIDWIGQDEGLGVVFSDRVVLLPNTCIDQANDGQPVPFVIQTGEISRSIPQSQTLYVRQIEFRMDWFVGDATFVVEGTDYYGRQVRVVKSLHQGSVAHDYTFWMEIGYYLENWNISITGTAAFRMTHWIAKVYSTSNKIGIVYGFDDHSSYKNRRNGRNDQHHTVRSYNDLREAIVP